MTAPSTIRPQRTAAPPATPALVDAEILAGQLVWTLQQIKERGFDDGVSLMELFVAIDAATEAQHRITSLQMREGRG